MLTLGKTTSYPDQYDPTVLHAIPRDESRAGYGTTSLPFDGVDLWNVYDLTWLGSGNRPSVAIAEIRVPASSPNLVESKSLKLYLGSFAMTRFDHIDGVTETIKRDLSATCGSPVSVLVESLAKTHNRHVAELAGRCLDSLEIDCDQALVDAALLRSDTSVHCSEELHTHLLRSLCPVTAQPDIGSLSIRYSGPQIDKASLLRYVVSFRQHNDFHEACIERMFVDILEHCEPKNLTVHARYQRRGGIDINPFRSNYEKLTANTRLWRQ